MINLQTEAQKSAMLKTLGAAYMEVFPTSTIEDQLRVLEPNSYVAVTCSPTRGVGQTIELTGYLAARGYNIIPHISARAVRNRTHLVEILARLADLPVDSVFVPGGDAKKPVGDYATAYELLRDMADIGHSFTDIGIGAHPEGHPDADAEVLFSELEKKQQIATYLVTQMCFDADLLGRWLSNMRDRGIHLDAWLGVPGVVDRGTLLKTSLRIGVGDSLRFLRRRPDVVTQLMKPKTYTPSRLLEGIAPLLTDSKMKISGYHIYCFNQVARTENWRQKAISLLQQD